MHWKLFEGDAPDYTTAEWYAERESAPHVDQDSHRGRMDIAAKFVHQAVRGYGVETVVDLGCGDGGMLGLLQGVRCWGYDLQQSNVEASKARGVDVRYGNVLEDDVEWGDLAITTEFLEHVVDPWAVVKAIGEHCKYLVASSPYTEDDTNAFPYHTWAFDVEGYKNLLESAGYEVMQTERWSMFQVHLAVKP